MSSSTQVLIIALLQDTAKIPLHVELISVDGTSHAMPASKEQTHNAN